MSVIITGMDLPGRCDECPLALNSECPLIGIDTDEEEGSRDMNCPLKSVDIVEELEKIKEEVENMWIKGAKDLRTGEVIYENLCEHSEVLEIINNHISDLKGISGIERIAENIKDMNERLRIEGDIDA